MARPAVVVIDDRLLIHELLVGLRRSGSALHTTAYWYHRACRAAVVGGGGHLSGPFARLPTAAQERAILAMLRLPDGIGLPDPRALVPVMADVAARHPRLNVLNVEALAPGLLLEATMWLSPEAVSGVLPAALDAERVRWRVVEVA